MSDSRTVCPPILAGLLSALPQLDGPNSDALLVDIIHKSRILLVGSGGIGCELLKNLALSGFRHVEVIDLDTIDVSNLNRQFLFRAHHVGLPKCVVASEAAAKMLPPMADDADSTTNHAEFLPHHGNILDNNKFNVPYIQRFSLVLNALDNVAARRRVNRLCLAASVPLIEAGTAGYLGQVTVIDKSAGVECYECQTKATPKVYPICTIRSTPTMPVHCVVWAKELYKLCFGEKVEESMLFEDEKSLRMEEESGEAECDITESTKETKMTSNCSNDIAPEIMRTKSDVTNVTTIGEKSTYMDLIIDLRSLLKGSHKSLLTKDNHSSIQRIAQQVLTALFVTEIKKQISMDRYRTAERVPTPLLTTDLAILSATDAIPPTQRENYQPTHIWSPSDCILEITSCFIQASTSTTPPLSEFDKDDDMAMRFVTAASNLRSYVFHINPIQSLYSAKGIAGNIIPAISTTNAIVAGLQVLQAIHVLKSRLIMTRKQREGGDNSSEKQEEHSVSSIKKSCRYIYCLRDKTRKGYYLQPTVLPDPNPNCFVCRNAILSLSLNTREWTLEMLLTRVIKKELGFSQPTILVGGDIVFEEGEDIDPLEYVANLYKKLIDLPSGGICHGSVVRIEDFTQDLEVEVSVSHKDEWFIVAGDERGNDDIFNKVDKGQKLELDDREECEKFEIGGNKPAVTASVISHNEPRKNDEHDNRDLVTVVTAPILPSTIDTNSRNNTRNGFNGSRKDDVQDSVIEIESVAAAAPVTSVNEECHGEAELPVKKRSLNVESDKQYNQLTKKAKVIETDDLPSNGKAKVEVINIDLD